MSPQRVELMVVGSVDVGVDSTLLSDLEIAVAAGEEMYVGHKIYGYSMYVADQMTYVLVNDFYIMSTGMCVQRIVIKVASIL